MKSLKTIWARQSLETAAYIKTPLDKLPLLRCFAVTVTATGNRMFVMLLDEDNRLPFQEKLTFRGVEVRVLNFEDSRELNILLTDNQLEDIFTAFLDNLIEELSDCKNNAQALPIIGNVIVKWKKLFDRAAFAGLTPEQQKGLFGELLLMDELFQLGYPAADIIDAWTGPVFSDQDYDFGQVRVEVKMTTAKNPVLTITSERQLRDIPETTLYLILYTADTSRGAGLSLPDLVARVGNFLSAGGLAGLYSDKLTLAGYNVGDEEFYMQKYIVIRQRLFMITEGFPRILAGDLPPGVRDVAYKIELSACEPYKLDDTTAGVLIYGY